MRLNDILKGTAVIGDIGQNPEITDITSDSRKCTPGCLFIAISGFDSDGHRFIKDAAARGAAAVVYQDPSADIRAASPGIRNGLLGFMLFLLSRYKFSVTQTL